MAKNPKQISLKNLIKFKMLKDQAEPLKHQLCREQVLRVKVCNFGSARCTHNHIIYINVCCKEITFPYGFLKKALQESLLQLSLQFALISMDIQKDLRLPWQAQRSILLQVNKNVSLDLHPLSFPGGIQDAGSSCGGVAQHRDTHLTTDVIYSHMHKDGSLFYALQVHVSVTWKRGSRAGTGPWASPWIQAWASPCHTQVYLSHTTCKLHPHFLSSSHKTALSSVIAAVKPWFKLDHILSSGLLVHYWDCKLFIQGQFSETRWVFFNPKDKLFSWLWKDRKIHTQEVLMWKKSELKTERGN